MSNTKVRLGALFTAIALTLGVAACGSSDDSSTSSGGGGGGGTAIVSNPKNAKVSLTVGSKNFTEEEVLGEIYAQALEAAGYKVKTDLSLGSETVALKALKAGEISGYPEYVSTALTAFFGKQPGQIPSDATQGADEVRSELEKQGLTSFAATPFADANAVGTLTSTAQKLGLKKVSDLKAKSKDLALYGSPECRQRIDCLAGLEKYYGLKFSSFHPVDIGLRYTVLDKGQADVSILFTSDAQLSAEKGKYTLLEDDKGIFPAGNLVWLTDPKVVSEAGPDYQKTIEQVQEGLTLPVIQELNSKVDIDKETAKQAATEYLQSAGYIK